MSGHTADYDAPFSWGMFPGADGLPAHLPIGVTAEGQGPTRDDDAHHWLCWCGKPDCLLNAALRKAWESGTRVTEGSAR